MTRNLTMDTNTNRYEKPVKTPVWGAEMPNPNSITLERNAEVGWSLSDITEPSRCQETAVTAEGAGTVATTKEWDRSENCITENATGRELATKSDQFREPMPDRVWPVVTENAPADGTGVMQCQWEYRKSVGISEMTMPRNYLEISEPRIPGVFLNLAEEARTIVFVDGQSVDTREVQPQRTGLTRPVFVAEMINSPPVLKESALGVTGTSTEMIPNMDLRGRGEPVNRSGPVGHFVSLGGRGEMVDRLDLVGPHNGTEQSVFLGLDVDQTEHVPSNRMHPGAKMYQNQPVADGPAARMEHAARWAPMGCMQYTT